MPKICVLNPNSRVLHQGEIAVPSFHSVPESDSNWSFGFKRTYFMKWYQMHWTQKYWGKEARERYRRYLQSDAWKAK